MAMSVVQSAKVMELVVAILMTLVLIIDYVHHIDMFVIVKTMLVILDKFATSMWMFLKPIMIEMLCVSPANADNSTMTKISSNAKNMSSILAISKIICANVIKNNVQMDNFVEKE